MASSINQKWVDALAKQVKATPGNSEKFYSDKCGIPMNQTLRHLVLAELQADPSLKIPATGKGIVKARNEGLRWPRIAARTGLSETKAKELFEAESGTSASESYTGRGRNWSGTASSAPKRGGGTTKAANTGTSGRRGAAGKAQPAKRGAAAVAGKRGTRAAAKAADPK